MPIRSSLYSHAPGDLKITIQQQSMVGDSSWLFQREYGAVKWAWNRHISLSIFTAPSCLHVIVMEGDQSVLLWSMPLWHMDYFELEIFEIQQMWRPSWSFPYPTKSRDSWGTRTVINPVSAGRVHSQEEVKKLALRRRCTNRACEDSLCSAVVSPPTGPHLPRLSALSFKILPFAFMALQLIG